jgi:hypothetical protein
MNAEMQEKVLQGLEDSGFLFAMKAKLREAIYAALKEKKAATAAFEKVPHRLCASLRYVGEVRAAAVAENGHV